MNWFCRKHYVRLQNSKIQSLLMAIFGRLGDFGQQINLLIISFLSFRLDPTFNSTSFLISHWFGFCLNCSQIIMEILFEKSTKNNVRYNTENGWLYRAIAMNETVVRFVANCNIEMNRSRACNSGKRLKNMADVIEFIKFSISMVEENLIWVSK